MAKTKAAQKAAAQARARAQARDVQAKLDAEGAVDFDAWAAERAQKADDEKHGGIRIRWGGKLWVSPGKLPLALTLRVQAAQAQGRSVAGKDLVQSDADTYRLLAAVWGEETMIAIAETPGVDGQELDVMTFMEMTVQLLAARMATATAAALESAAGTEDDQEAVDEGGDQGEV